MAKHWEGVRDKTEGTGGHRDGQSEKKKKTTTNGTYYFDKARTNAAATDNDGPPGKRTGTVFADNGIRGLWGGTISVSSLTCRERGAAGTGKKKWGEAKKKAIPQAWVRPPTEKRWIRRGRSGVPKGSSEKGRKGGGRRKKTNNAKEEE